MSNLSQNILNTIVFDDHAPAAYWLKQGNLLCYPTESVWGIGCDAYDEQAVHAILAIKNRPIDKGMIVVTDSVERIANLLAPLSVNQRQAIITSWQTPDPRDTSQPRQAHTWLLPIVSNHSVSNHINHHVNHHIPSWITGKHRSVAVRVIAHPLIAKLCASLVSEQNPYGFLVSTSCNPAGDEPAKTLHEAMAYFSDHSQIKFLQGNTLSYELPSQIQDGLTGRLIR